MWHVCVRYCVDSTANEPITTRKGLNEQESGLHAVDLADDMEDWAVARKP
jgi:hypothetical protein